MKLVLILFSLIIIYTILQATYSLYYSRKATELNKKTFSGKKTLGSVKNPIFKLFVAGDSIAAGVAASSFETSVVGRLADYFSKDYFVQMENIGKVGNRMRDLTETTLPKERQNLIVLIISSNDLFHFTNLVNFKTETRKVLKRYSALTKKLVIVGPGNIAEPAAIPLVLKPIYSIQGPKYAKAIAEATEEFENIYYVNPIEHPTGSTEYKSTYASDNFHPNDEGHRYWFDTIRLGGDL